MTDETFQPISMHMLNDHVGDMVVSWETWDRICKTNSNLNINSQFEFATPEGDQWILGGIGKDGSRIKLRVRKV